MEAQATERQRYNESDHMSWCDEHSCCVTHFGLEPELFLISHILLLFFSNFFLSNVIEPWRSCEDATVLAKPQLSSFEAFSFFFTANFLVSRAKKDIAAIRHQLEKTELIRLSIHFVKEIYLDDFWSFFIEKVKKYSHCNITIFSAVEGLSFTDKGGHPEKSEVKVEKYISK